MSESVYDPSGLEEGDPFPCPGCSPTSLPDELRDLSREHWDGEVAAVDGEFVQGRHCGSWYHRELLVPREEYERREALTDIFANSGKESLPVGEWVEDTTTTQMVRIENPVLAEGGEVTHRAQTDVEVSDRFPVGATTYVFKDKLLELLQVMDGNKLRLDVQDGGLVIFSAVNWKRQRMQGAVAPLHADSRHVEKLDKRLADWLDAFENEEGDGAD